MSGTGTGAGLTTLHRKKGMIIYPTTVQCVIRTTKRLCKRRHSVIRQLHTHMSTDMATQRQASAATNAVGRTRPAQKIPQQSLRTHQLPLPVISQAGVLPGWQPGTQKQQRVRQQSQHSSSSSPAGIRPKVRRDSLANNATKRGDNGRGVLTTNCLTARVQPVAFAALVVIILGRHNPATAPTGYAPGPFAAVAAYCDISMPCTYTCNMLLREIR